MKLQFKLKISQLQLQFHFFNNQFQSLISEMITIACKQILVIENQRTIDQELLLIVNHIQHLKMLITDLCFVLFPNFYA